MLCGGDGIVALGTRAGYAEAWLSRFTVLRPMHHFMQRWRCLAGLPAAARETGYVPQDLALFPHLTVREHLAFALELRRRPAAEVAEVAGWLGIAHLLERRPRGLSGGEAQRVALGRALAFRPAGLLLDEPLSALDDATRDEMRAVLRAVRERTQVTMLHVTHHRDDARALADMVLELREGKIHKAA